MQDVERDPISLARISLVERVVSIYSPSGEERELASGICSELKSKGLSPRIDSAGNVLCEIAGKGSGSLLLCGHMDTVPGRLEVCREGSVLYGRGACDAKGPLMSLLFAFEDVAQLVRAGACEPLGKLIFAAVVNEEGDSSGLNRLIKEGVRADYAIFGEPGGAANITVGYRGHLPAFVEVRTREIHASAPHLTTNSAELAFEVYYALKRALSGQGEASTMAVSVALTEIQAGSSHNVIPGRTRMTLDVRIPVEESSSGIRSRIESIIDGCRNSNPEATIIAAFGEATEPFKARTDSPLFRAMNRSILKSVLKPSLIVKSGTGDMNTYACSFGVQALTYGPGEARLSHTPEEKIDMNEVFACSKILVEAVRELFGNLPS